MTHDEAVAQARTWLSKHRYAPPHDSERLLADLLLSVRDAALEEAAQVGFGHGYSGPVWIAHQIRALKTKETGR
jgi:hypothetical protein